MVVSPSHRLAFSKNAMNPANLPMLSVVIPVYNEEQEISELLESLLDLNWPSDRLEILCVDNNSTDKSLEILRSYPITVLQEATPGPYAARNTAISQAQGEFIAFTDADCKVSPNWLLELWQAFDTPDVGAVGGSIIPRTVSNYVDYFEGCVFKSPNHSRGTDRIKPYVVTANVMYRKAAFDQLGLFDDKSFSGPDVEMSWRIVQSGYYTLKICPDHQAIVQHRYRTQLRDFTYVLERDAYGWFFLASTHPQMAPIPQPFKYFLKLLLGLIVYPWTTMVRILVAPIRRSPTWELPQDLLRLAVLWHHFVGTWTAKLAHQGLQPPRLLR
jgi:cellulose synthase/poly-beta-1,6-N-acetylglucosamine synthase-like glycosyltransferase